ncbi:MAG: hypothetical protein KAT32_05145 [Candidatus Moranbacteria bacterium]|nr:hypothetical protein [Candidatus Moranbacteria bacterium]
MKRYEFVIRFQMSKDDIKFFENLKFNYTNTRVPLALEIDLVDKKGIFGYSKGHVIADTSSIPSEALLKPDVGASDSEHQYSVIIMRPDKLKANTLYEIVFRQTLFGYKEMFKWVYGDLRLSFQLSANYKLMTA